MELSHSPHQGDKNTFIQISELLRIWAFPERKKPETLMLRISMENLRGYPEI